MLGVPFAFKAKRAKDLTQPTDITQLYRPTLILWGGSGLKRWKRKMMKTREKGEKWLLNKP